MPNQKIVSTFVVTVIHDDKVKDLVDHVAGRVYQMDGVSDATATLIGSVEQRDQAWVPAAQKQ